MSTDRHRLPTVLMSPWLVMHDRDTKFTKSFDEVFESADVEVTKTAHCSPNTCAFVERFIQTLGQECLDYFVVFGERHLDYLVGQFKDHYHLERPHQSLENQVPVRKGYRRKTADPPSSVPLSTIGCQTRLGGLLKHYYRKAA
jgi:putative transposase